MGKPQVCRLAGDAVPWVNINGNRYYSRSQRVCGKVVTEYVGSGWMLTLEAKLDANTRTFRRMANGTGRERGWLLVEDYPAVLAVDTLLAGRRRTVVTP